MSRIREVFAHPHILLRTAAISALLTSILILLITSDTFSHGTLFIFPAWLGVIIGATGIAGGLLTLAGRVPGIVLLR